MSNQSVAAGSPGHGLASLGLWSGLAILVVVSVATYLTTAEVIDSTAGAEHGHEVIERLIEEREALAAAEAARRAHGLDGGDTALAAYAGAIHRLEAKGAEVRRLIAGDAAQQRRWSGVEPLVEQRVALLDAAVERRRRGVVSPEEASRQLSAGAAADARISAAISELVEEELRLLALRRARTARSMAVLRPVKAAAMLTSVVILLLAFRRLQQEVVRRIALEKAARESEESLGTTLMSIGDGVISTDAGGRVVRINRVAEALTGWTGGSAVGRPASEVFRSVDTETRTAAPDPVARALREGGTVKPVRHTLLLGKDGQERVIDDSCAPVRSADGRISGAILVFRDASQEQRAKQAEEAAQRQIIISERMASVGTLAAGVAHEINNPLAYVTANLDLILEEVQFLSGASSSGRAKDLAEMAAEAREGAERVRKIVRGLKTFSRMDEEQHAVVDVTSVLELSIDMVFNEIRHRARLVKDYGEIPHVEGDEARLGQVFINLLANAAQAIPEGDTRANEIRISTFTDAEGRAVIEVKDTGPGIAQSVIGRIFDPFFTTKPVGVGTGLGLSICHNIVTAIGGELGVKSEPGRGATFRVVLPAATGQPAARSDGIEPAEPGAPRARVLIVDDDRAVGVSLGRVLRSHQVTVVTRAKEALDLLAAGRQFDVILSDLMMPEMSGMELYEALVRLHPGAAGRVVFLTGGAFTPGANAFLERVPNERIEKPFDARAMRALVQKFAS